MHTESGHLARSTLLGLMLLLGAAGAVWVWHSGPPSEEALEIPEEWAEMNPADPDDAASGARKPTSQADEENALPADLRKVYTEVTPAAKDEGRSLVLQVWNRKKGVPAAKVDVFYLQDYKGQDLKDPYGSHWSDLATIHGRRFQTDLRGRVELPPIHRWTIVTAQDQDAYGFAVFRPIHRDLETITMHADETLRVHVTDGEGHPVAGAPVGLVQRIPVRKKTTKATAIRTQLKQLRRTMADIKAWMRDHPDQRDRAAAKQQKVARQLAKLDRAVQKQQGGLNKKGNAKRQPGAAPQSESKQEIRTRRRTDEEGMAVFRHFQVYRRDAQKWWPVADRDQFEAVLLMPMQQVEARPFGGRPAPRETIELRLPPTGSLALRPVDLEGRPFSHPVRAALQVQGGKPAPWGNLQARKQQNERLILFPFVGLGLRFVAHSRLDDNDFRWKTPPFAGPTKLGERVTVDVVVAPSAGMLHGRILDASGKPMSGVRLDFLINSAAGRLEGEALTLDPKGRFHLTYLVQKTHRPPYRLEIRRPDARLAAGLTRALPTLPLGRVTDLGDLRLGTLPLIAYGHVLDDSHKAVEGARIKLHRRRQTGGKSPRLSWHEEAFTSTQTDAEGYYELHADLEPGTYRLWSQAKDHFPFVSRGFVAGAKADIELLRKSRVVGTVLAPTWLVSKNIRVRLIPSLAGAKPREDRMRDYKGKRYVYFDWVKPGTYRVELRVTEVPDPILRIDGVVVQPGQQAVHPRLKDLDLESRLHRFVITAVDGRRKAIRPKGPLLARIQRPNGRSGWIGYPWRGGRVTIVSQRPQLDVLPFLHGYRAEQALLNAGPSQIRFLKIPPVRIRLPGLPGLVGKTPTWIALSLESPSSLPAKLESWDPRSNKIARWYDYLSKNGGVQMFKNDTVTIPLTRDGRYQVVVHLGTKKEITTVKIPLGVVDVRLVAGAAPQLLTVNFDAERIRAGLAEVERRRSARK